jgi:hypothetical protein
VFEVVATMKATNESTALPNMSANTSLHEVPINESTSLPNVNANTSLHEIPKNKTYIKHSIRKKKRKLVCLDVFEVGIHWQSSRFKFDGLWNGYNHLTDYSLNKFGLGDLILKGEKETITKEIKLYIRRLTECLLHNMAEGIDACMIRWWENRGWSYPWTYPVCH